MVLGYWTLQYISCYIDLVTNIKTSIDQWKIVLGVFIDLKRASDTVNQGLLIRKIVNIGESNLNLQFN